MDFRFILDKHYLLMKMIENKSNIDELNSWKCDILSNLLGREVIEEIEDNNSSIEEYFVSGKSILSDDSLDLKVSKAMKTEIFIKYYKECLDYLNLVKFAWENISTKINDWFKKVVKLNVSKRMINVYISHPKLNTGKCVNQSSIFWGHWRGLEDINYNIVYLCHECLHALLPSSVCMPEGMKLYYDKEENVSAQEHWKNLNSLIKDYYKIFDFEFDVIHTVIELISDNELYTILSGVSKYEEGHNDSQYSLTRYKKLILPYWFLYLGLSSEDISLRIPDFTYSDDVKGSIFNSIESFISFLIDSQIRRQLDVPELIYDKSEGISL